MQVLTADAEDAQRGEFGVVRAWIDALAVSAPDVALVSFRPYADVLGGLFPSSTISSLIRRRWSRRRPALHAARVLQVIREFLLRASKSGR